MSNDYAKLIDQAVTKICVATGKTRQEIAVELGYTPTYISGVINRGGNKKFYDTLLLTYAEYLNALPIPDAVNEYEQALLKTLLEDYIKLKAKVTNRSVEDIAEELDKNTELTLRSIKHKK